MSDFAFRRTMMVDTQVRPNDVTKFPIIEAMLTVPREVFVPDAAREAAYAGDNIDLGGGRVMLEPRTLAKMFDALDIQPGHRVLIVGAGLGYSAAVAGRMAASVVALEARADMAEAAAGRLASVGAGNVAVQNGPLEDGAAKAGPFDRILIEGGVEHVPGGLTDQLAEGGRLAAVFMEGALGVVRIGHRADGRLSWRYAFNAAAPLLVGFVKEKGFTF